MQSAINIMVVDDEAGICRNVEKILTKANYHVTCVTSAQEALNEMAATPYDLVISDIVMPGMNGLDLLKSIKSQWPVTKAVMMTAYASTDTAMKAIRLGALDYLPKPFTPTELRNMVEQALSGKLIEAKISPAERKAITVIDKDIPFDHDEVARYTGEAYARSIGPSDMPVVEVRANQPLEGFCEIGAMACDIFKKLGVSCKAGTKSGECPRKKAALKKAAAGRPTDLRRLVGVDQPFNYDEVQAATGAQYLNYLRHDGVVTPTYEELKANVAALERARRIDVDVPFDRDEVAQVAGEAYARRIGPSDMPVVEIIADPAPPGFCQVGEMVCDIFKKLGATCKSGTKSGACPQKKAKIRAAAVRPAAADPRRLIAPDMPFDYQEVAAVTGQPYVQNLLYEGVVQLPYEQLKARYQALLAGDAAVQTTENNVLVIDDEAAVNNNIRKILAKNDYRVEQAAGKEEALAKIAANRYSLVLLDLRIPGVNGLELLAAVRAAQPQARVVIVTGYASIETAKEAARMGAVDYLSKPFTPAEIRQVADRAIRLAA